MNFTAGAMKAIFIKNYSIKKPGRILLFSVKGIIDPSGG
jgi:hypothetical protein